MTLDYRIGFARLTISLCYLHILPMKSQLLIAIRGLIVYQHLIRPSNQFLRKFIVFLDYNNNSPDLTIVIINNTVSQVETIFSHDCERIADSTMSSLIEK